MLKIPVKKARPGKRDHASAHEPYSEIMPPENASSENADGRDTGNAHRKGRSIAVLARVMKFIALTIAILGLLVGGLALALQQGLLDGIVEGKVRVALAQAAGDRFETELAGAGLSLTSQGRLALEARNVTLTPVSGGAPSHVEKIRLVLQPLSLLAGRIKVASVEAAGIRIAPSPGRGFRLRDLAGMRIDEIEPLIEAGFTLLDRTARDISRRGTPTLTLSDLTIAGKDGVVLSVIEGTLSATSPRELELTADLAVGSEVFSLSARAFAQTGSRNLSQIEGQIGDIAINFTTGGIPERHFGAATTLGIAFSAGRAGPGREPSIEIEAIALPGSVTLGGVSAELKKININLSYIASAKKIEILPSVIEVASTRIPFSGGLIDIDRLDGEVGEGLAFDLVINDAIAAPGDSQDVPVRFNAKAFGRILPADGRIIADELALAVGRESMRASASLRVVKGLSPEVNLYASTRRMATTAVKQLWPYWLGKRPRQWALANIYGGTVRNAQIRLAIPAGHFVRGRKAEPFTDEEFQIDFDVERARMNVAGDIPPLRDTVGHLRLRGDSVTVNIASATAYFPTGRTVAVQESIFSIADTNARPLMADLDLSVAGNADAVAELITYHPIDVLDRLDLVPEDITGSVSAKVKARFGLIRTQNPPPPDWSVDLDLDGVDISRPIEGRNLANLAGSLEVTPVRAELVADALVDGVPLALDIVAPVGESDVVPERRVSGTLDNVARRKLAPGTDILVNGPVELTLFETGKKGPKIVLDLQAASVTLPGIGWSKGKGIEATARFDLISNENGQSLEGFSFKGEGFEVAGKVSLDEGELASADFKTFKLSPEDAYSVRIDRSPQGYRVAVSGRSADLRPLIANTKKTVAREEKPDAKPVLMEVTGKIDKVRGFGSEWMSAATFSYAGTGARTNSFDFRAVTASGQAMVITLGTKEGEENIQLSSGDAGAFARFAGIYGKMRGGLLNINLKRSAQGPRKGILDIRNFEIVGEEKLGALITSPVGEGGRSISARAGGKINASRAGFEVAHAKLEIGAGYLTVSEGIARGPQIGASFQGIVYDAKGNMEVTGTLMPAYGINRLFGELPLIGGLLGNGRDRGLIGITFRLIGKASSPQVEINPLSVIAPGVFRSIFEYR